MQIRQRSRTSAIVALGFSVVIVACSPTRQTAPSAYRKQVLEDSPAGYWRLDETFGTSIFDQTQNSNNGTLQGAITMQQPGATTSDGNAAILFNGTGQILVPNATSLQIKDGSITLEAWVKPMGLQAGEIPILGKGTAGVQTEYALVLIDGVLGYQSVAERYLSTSGALVRGMWTHVAVTIDRNTSGIFYVNGAQAGTFSPSGNHAVSFSTQPVMIGNESGLNANFIGAIDEPAIYPLPLTGERLMRHVALARAAPGQ